MTDHDRAAGVLLGLACGDALGRPVEFRTSASIAGEYGRLTELRGGGTHGQPAGTVTDDTDLARCLAESLLACGGFDPVDVGERFRAWYDAGPFDVGGMTADVLDRLERGTDPRPVAREVWEARPEGQNAGNGSLMRCAPLAVAYDDPGDLAAVAAASSAVTHADPRCVEACVALTRTVRELLDGAEPETALDEALGLAGDRDAPREVRTALATATDRAAASLETSGYVVHTLETGLHDGLTASTAEEAVVAAVNRGGDADTVGAVSGAVAGARFGAEALPNRWLDQLEGVDRLHELAVGLADGSFDTGSGTT